MMWLTVLAWGIAAWWCLAFVQSLLNHALVPRLETFAGEENPPTLSVVVPARNEEAGVEAALRSHLEQDYPGLEVVVCDDGSTDRTPGILEALSREFARLKIVRGTEPPPGWLGKPNAQAQALSRTSGELVLFADADVRYAPGSHRRLAAFMKRENADMAAVLGLLEGRGLEPLVLSFLDAFTTYAAPSFLINHTQLRFLAVGTGSGNLVRRRALKGAGGLEAVKAEVVDDVALARAIRGAGFRVKVVTAYRNVAVRMYPSFRASIEGFTKNMYSAFRRNPLFALAGSALDILVHVLPAAALPLVLSLSRQPAVLGAPLLVSVSLGVICNSFMAAWSRQPWWTALIFPVRTLLWAWIQFRSLLRFRRRGIVWRGRSYSFGKGQR
ncbi:MAG: glycosyltransferase [Acidobacteriota bacterium]